MATKLTRKTSNKKADKKNTRVNWKGSWKKLSYLGLSGFLVVLSFGYGTWNLYQLDKANAAGLFAKSGGYCTSMNTYRGPVYYTVAPSSGKTMQILALSGSSWVTVGYWASPWVQGGGSYLIPQSSIKAYGNGGYVAMKAVFTMYTGAKVTDSCYARV